MFIGITCDFETITDRRGCPAQRFVIPEPYVAAVQYAGAHPLLLPHGPPHTATAYLQHINALVVAGGDFDVPPSYYGEPTRAVCGKLLPERTAFEHALLEGALERDMPLLGICGGMQLLNVVTGGTLYQDLSERPHTAVHEQPQDKRQPFHAIDIAPNSQLAKILGDTPTSVNSTHHQILRDLGKGVVASAKAPDGVVEAIEMPEKHFVLGVQWHPEILGTDAHLGLYRSLVQAAQR
ncbi:MAG: gamma-glutamyl-gamma-aminobutyrate hydrolase family protein [Myxococcota bacterium]